MALLDAVTLAHYQRLGEIFEEIGQSDSVHCAILTAAGFASRATAGRAGRGVC